jgi:hypothetical protein
MQVISQLSPSSAQITTLEFVWTFGLQSGYSSSNSKASSSLILALEFPKLCLSHKRKDLHKFGQTFPQAVFQTKYTFLEIIDLFWNHER